MSAPTKAAIYRRISTSGQEDNTSLEVQQRACIEHAAKLGYQVVADYCDVHSGADLWFRAQLQEALNDAEAGIFDVILVNHTDRLSRDVDHLAFLRVQLKRCGVRVESVTNPRTESFEDRLMSSFEGLFAQYERGRIQARMTAGRRHRVEKEGRLQPGSTPLFGYSFDDPAQGEKNRYVENPAQSWIVKRVFREAVEGKSLRQIAKGLNDDGLKTVRGKKWQARQVSRILSHPYYRGYTAANRYTSRDNGAGKRTTSERPESEWVVTPGLAPALVDDETWYKANERLELNKREKTRPYDGATDALLRAGYVYCKWCGGHMSVHRQHGRVYYRCNNAHFGTSESCKGKTIEASKLDDFVWNRVSSWLGDPGILLHEARQNRPALEAAMAEDLTVYDDGLQKISEEQENLARLVGRLSDEAAAPILDRLTQLGREKATLLSERQAAEGRVEAARRTADAVESIWTDIVAYAERVEVWDYDQKREFIKRMGLRVTVEKQGVGKARFWVDVSPPWPEGTPWWDGLFGEAPNGPFDQGGEREAVTSVGAFVLAAIGSKTASHVAASMSCVSFATSARLAVWPRAFAVRAAERKTARALPTRTVVPVVDVYGVARPLARSRSSSRSREIRACGRRVGAAMTTVPPTDPRFMRMYESSWASISSLPAWREKTTANWSPRPARMLSAIARAASIW